MAVFTVVVSNVQVSMGKHKKLHLLMDDTAS